MSHDNSCPNCDYNARNPKLLEFHLKHRIPGEAYSCKICDKKWCTKFGMLQHKRRHKIKTGPKEPNDVTKFICEICDFMAKTRFSLKRHLSTKHKDYDTENIPTYSKVKQDDENSEDVTKVLSDQTGNTNVQDSVSDIPDFDHQPKHVGIKFKQYNVQDYNEKRYMYQCQYCDFSDKHRNRLDNHLKLRKKGQSFTCKFCPKKWCNPKGLATHMYRSHPEVYTKSSKVKKTSNPHEKNIKCQFCDLVAYKRHISSHLRNKKENSGTELKVCDICGFKSCTKRLLNRHKIVEHSAYPKKKPKSGDPRSGNFSCVMCDYTTNMFKFYKRHLKFKEEDKENILYKCRCHVKLCSEGAFLTHRYLKHNLRKPANEKLKQKILSRSAVDQTHKLNPKNDRNMLCKYCPYSTYYKRNLARHIHKWHDNVNGNVIDDVEDEISNEYHEEILNVKTYNVLPKPLKGTWIVVLEKIEELL